MRFYKLLLTILLLLPATGALSQSSGIRGTVTDDKGEPLPGVNVVVVGTQTGSTTDLDGAYAIRGLQPGAYDVRATMVGFAPATVTAQVKGGIETVVNLKLREETIGLEEVVVVGYGTQRRRDITGAVSSVEGKELALVKAPSFNAALQGQASGVQVSQSNGTPGAASRVLIRGSHSISAGSEPLYVIDGLPVAQDGITGHGGVNPLAAINPNDIASIEILKDAAATAIYGSRGANGVVLVTTKSGTGKSKTTVDYRVGSSTASNMLEMVDAQTWLSLVDQAFANDGYNGRWDPVVNASLVSPFVGNQQTYFTRAMADSIATLGGTDWLSPIWGSGISQELNFSTQGGVEKASYYLSARYSDDQGMIKGQGLTTYGLRANVRFQPLDRLTTELRTNFTSMTNNMAQMGGANGATAAGGMPDRGNRGGYQAMVRDALPILPITMADGSWYDPMGGRNVVLYNSTEVYRNWAEQNRAILAGNAEYKLTKDLRVRGEAAADLMYNTDRTWASDLIRVSKYGEVTNTRTLNINANLVATYSKTFGSHAIEAMAGTERQQRSYDNTHNRAQGLNSPNEYIGNPGLGDPTNPNLISMSTGISPGYRMQSYFTRANYNFQDRYQVSASLRRDGASVFGQENRWGLFPSASLGWVVTEESFAKNGLGPVNYLKLRTSYGRTGNADIPFVLEDQFSQNPQYGTQGAAVQSVFGVPTITWENTNMVDVATDFRAFNSRIHGSLGYFVQDINDMLLSVPTAPSQGLLNGGHKVWSNVGSLRNQGVEFELHTTNIFNPNGLTWTTDFNVGTVKNSVVSLSPNIDQSNAGIITGNSITKTGTGLGAFYMAEFAHVDRETGYPMIYQLDRAYYDETGDTRRLKDENGNDVVILGTSKAMNDNRFILEDRSSLPTWYGGLRNSVTYKGFDLSALITFQGGNYIYDNTFRRVNGGNNVRVEYLDEFWTPENKDARFPRLTLDQKTAPGGATRENLGTYSASTLWLQKADFLRLRNVQLGYTLPTRLTQKLGGSTEFRLYVNATNLLTFTGYDGIDPEIVNLDSDRQNRNLRQGYVESPAFPQSRTITGGMTVTF